ncbi:hypothetical protein BDV12DRAFT_200341 [Aspergillus spectabilis]
MAVAQDQEVRVDVGERQYATPVDMTEDWGFLTSDAAFNPGIEPMSWLFNDDFSTEMSLFGLMAP